MGSVFSPDFGNLFCGYLEDKHVWKNNPFKDHIILWRRYIDDIFLLWKAPLDTFHAFLDYLNSLVPSIKFNAEVSKTDVTFLDTRISINAGKLSSTLYTKSTDRNSLLHASSAHPVPLKKGLPYSQFLRLKRICSNDSDFEEKAGEMYKRFLARSYPKSWLDTALNQVYQMDMNAPRQTREKKKHSVTCATTYSPLSREIKDTITKHWHILGSDPVCQKLFSDPPLFCHYRSRNIKDSLVRADTYDPPAATGRLTDMTGFFPCRSCAACKDACKRTDTFTSHTTGKQYDIRQFTTCSSSQVIYLLACPCNLQYIGKTSRKVKTRIIEHQSAIRRGDEKSSVARHFRDAGHSVSSLTFCVIQQINTPRRRGNVEQRLLQAECRWIFKMQTLHPAGLNEEMSLNCFL